jgi:sulfur-oxidizing protein SoxZ
MANTIRAQAQLADNGMTTVKLVIRHPMIIERVDPKTGQTIQPHFIEELRIAQGGETLIEAVWGQAVSVNPFFQFSFSGAKVGDTITVSWRDNRGETDSTQVQISDAAKK